MMVQTNQMPSTMLSPVQSCTAPSENARAGNTSIVQPLVADELALRADVKLFIRLPPRT